MARRWFDVLLAGGALAISAPMLAVVSVAIRIDSPGPILFRQTRVGKDKKPIHTLKLRTMVVDAEAHGNQITASRDPRVTRVGRWLRRTKLDELPQLWNVVRGDMSLVGPRPEVPRYVQGYRPEWQRLFTVRPGLTDVASIAFRDEERLLAHARDHDRAYRDVIMPLKLALALEGIAKDSVRDDVLVIARTLAAIVFGPGQREATVLEEARRRIELLNADLGVS